MKSTINTNEIKKIIKQSVKESVKETISIEMMKLRAELLHYISDKEQKEIDDLYSKPENTVAESLEVKV